MQLQAPKGSIDSELMIYFIFCGLIIFLLSLNCTQENIPKLFGQYVQFDANKLQGGSGSGLGLWRK